MAKLKTGKFKKIKEKRRRRSTFMTNGCLNQESKEYDDNKKAGK